MLAGISDGNCLLSLAHELIVQRQEVLPVNLHTNTRKHTRARAHTHTHVRAHTHKHKQAHTHTRTHTHTPHVHSPMNIVIIMRAHRDDATLSARSSASFSEDVIETIAIRVVVHKALNSRAPQYELVRNFSYFLSGSLCYKLPAGTASRPSARSCKSNNAVSSRIALTTLPNRRYRPTE